MAHFIKFYPVGNGDTSQIILDNGKRILIDFYDCNNIDFNIADNLREELKKDDKDYFDVVAFTHGDADHIKGSSDFFELSHAEKYKGDERIKMNELWIPATMVLESTPNEKQSEDLTLIRQEARYRIRECNGDGIKVFSNPNQLKEWFEKNNVPSSVQKKIIVNAGTVVPTFSLVDDNVEFFTHSPFIKYSDNEEVLRNESSLIFNVRFSFNDNIFNYFVTGDTKAEVLVDMVDVTKVKGNEERLEWDIYGVPHHCSYLSLNRNEKGEKETIPEDNIKTLLNKGNIGCYIISSSNEIKDDDDAYAQTTPPHVQAKNCYEKYLKENIGTKFLVTMENKIDETLSPIVVIINGDGISLERAVATAASVITSKPAPRAG